MQTTDLLFRPPMLNGVTASKVFLPQLTATPHSLWAYLSEQFAHISAEEWSQRFTDGLVYDMYGHSLTTESPYLANQHVFYYRFLAHEIHVPFQHEILFENDHILVVDKPHFLTMSPTGQYVQETLLVRLKKQTKNAELSPIHRLDRETAGVVLFSKHANVRAAYQQLFASRMISKTYHAIAPFRAELQFPQRTAFCMQKGDPFYTMQIVEGVPNSVTDIDIIEHHEYMAKYLLRPVTGKQHQLRVHLNALSLAILNDPFYPVVQHKADNDFSAPLQLLAKSIAFTDPLTGQEMYFESKQELTL